MGELLGAAACGVPGAVDGVAVAEEDVDGEAAVRRGAHVRAEGAVRGRVPGHPVADALLVGEGLVDRTLGDDDEPGVVVVQELQAGELRGEPRAARALPFLAGEPHVVVDDQLALAVEEFGQAYGAVLAVEGVVGHLHHRQPTTLGGDGVQLPGRGLLAGTESCELGLPCRGVHDGRQCVGGHDPSQSSWCGQGCPLVRGRPHRVPELIGGRRVGAAARCGSLGGMGEASVDQAVMGFVAAIKVSDVPGRGVGADVVGGR